MTALGIVAAGLAAAALGLGARSLDGDEWVLPAPGRDGWERLELPGIDRLTRYRAVDLDGVAAVRSESQCSASALAVSLDGLDLRRTPVLRWRWKVERGLEPHDERVRDGDDFAARVYVMFRIDPALASFRDRAEHWVKSRLVARELPGQALNYVRSSREAAGRRWDNPFAASSKMVSLGAGPLPEWREERVDVLADYRALFGAEPSAPLGLAIMTDTDNTCGSAGAWFADFRFSAPAVTPEAPRAYDPPETGAGEDG